MHDTYRVNRGGNGTHHQVMKGLAALRRHDVDVNILCTVNAANEDHGAAVYRYFRDELEVSWMQFIPIVERATPGHAAGGEPGMERETWPGSGCSTPSPGRWSPNARSARRLTGQFLVDVYEEWLRGDVGTVFVQLFDVTLEGYFGQYSLCVHAPTCGTALALEHNGDLYSCDHYVEPDHLLGNIHETHLLDLVTSPRQQAFGRAKRDTLTAQCRSCDVLALCDGGYPKDRFVASATASPGTTTSATGCTASTPTPGPP